MISDAKMRAHLLSAIHGLRNSNTGWVPVSDMNFGGVEPITPGRIHTACEQLAEAGLFAFRPAPGGPDRGLVGMSKITGHGCDVVDGLATARIALDFSQKVQPAPASSAAAAAGPAGASLPLQQPDTAEKSSGAQSQPAPENNIQSEVLTLKPTLWGMSIDLKEAYRRVRRRWLQRNA
jgi:hypothetical protein